MQIFNKSLGVYEDAPVPSVAQLSTLPPFKDFDERVLKGIQPHVAVVHHDKGDVILREGEYGDSAHYILKGTVEVIVPLPLRGKAAALKPRPAPPTQAVPGSLGGKLRTLLTRHAGSPATAQMPSRPESGGTLILTSMPADVVAGERILLEKGEIFGEIAALSRYPHSASVVADTECTTLQMRTQALRLIQKKSPEFKEFVDKRYRQRALSNHLRSVRLFSDLDEALLKDLTEKVQLYSYEPGEVIVKEGDPADAFYLVRAGFVKVSQRAGEGDLTISYISKGEHCGEIALLLEEPWIFTLTAYDHVEIVRMSRDEFRDILEKHPRMKKELWEVTVERLKERGRVVATPGASSVLQMALDEGLIHGNSILLIDLETCTRCDDCVRGCASTHGGTPRFIREGTKYQNILVPTACYHCTDPVCMIGCPTGAITRVGASYQVVITDACIGCGNCVNRCPWGNIVPVAAEEGGVAKTVSTKCDLCQDAGGRPACVYNCPNGSATRINFKDLDRVLGQLRH
ncbi:MAG TPA: cyclic nucleotide-binding domain-containing protein [Candidatus Saccharimonadales bacterium]|nr:cyclic nucleotide-binding domain-containing protein [Candidatus Saccharimonadales bacterium]